MGYLDQFEAELAKKLGTPIDDPIIRFVSEKILESYRNGINAGQAGEEVIRSGKSRRPFGGKEK
jgi:hypothetical protein